MNIDFRNVPPVGVCVELNKQYEIVKNTTSVEVVKNPTSPSTVSGFHFLHYLGEINPQLPRNGFICNRSDASTQFVNLFVNPENMNDYMKGEYGVPLHLALEQNWMGDGE